MVKTPPYTVWIYVAIVAAVILVELAIGGIDSSSIDGGLTLVGASLGLLVGIWFAWLFLTFVSAAHLVVYPWIGPASWDLLLNGILLALLLLPPTRLYTVRWRPRFRG